MIARRLVFTTLILSLFSLGLVLPAQAGNERIKGFEYQYCSKQYCYTLTSEEARRNPMDHLFVLKDIELVRKKDGIIEEFKASYGYFNIDTNRAALYSVNGIEDDNLSVKFQ